MGFDLEAMGYPGPFAIQDVKTLDGKQFRNFDLIVASPPCEEFSRWTMPWTRAKNPPYPNVELVAAARRIAKEADLPLVLENVRGAQPFIGQARAHYGPFYLWGDVPAILPPFAGFRKKESYGSKERSRRAEIPVCLGAHIGRTFAAIT